jgi:hypothetical protein
MFGFHRNEVRLQLSVGDQFGKVFDDMRLRRDRVGRNDVHIRLLDRFRGGDRYFHSNPFSHDYFSSSSTTIVIAPVGHSFAQIPHPLQ